MKLFSYFIAFFAVTSLCLVSPSLGQKPANVNMEILAEKVKADKKLVVAMNMNLSDKEAKSFWPVYESYQSDIEHVNQRLGQLVSDYANAFNSGSISNDTAGKLIKEWLHAEAEEMRIRVANVKKLAKVLPATKVARYLQIENKIRAVLRFQLAAGVPLVY
ncbi:MAG: hypothetical protein GKS05_01160 [Nitrospirales bacterium]|nr:hypothetical protein [Nitrospirales bacterium]